MLLFVYILFPERVLVNYEICLQKKRALFGHPAASITPTKFFYPPITAIRCNKDSRYLDHTMEASRPMESA